MKFKKKPVVIDAIQWTGGNTAELERFTGMNWSRADAHDIAWEHPDDAEEVVIYNSLEKSWIPCPVTHWIVRGIKGEFYPVEADVFAQTYEPAEA